MKFQSKLDSVRIGGNKLNKQLSDMENIKKFYKSWEEVIKFYNDYFKMVDKAVYDSKHGKGLKILILNKCFTVKAHVKAGNTSENLPNEISKIIHSLYREKEVTKKVYNNITNSVKL